MTGMPTDFAEWKEEIVSVCLGRGNEPWPTGVWDKGAHGTSCPWQAEALRRTAEWSPAFPCTCTEDNGETTGFGEEG